MSAVKLRFGSDGYLREAKTKREERRNCLAAVPLYFLRRNSVV